MSDVSSESFHARSQIRPGYLIDGYRVEGLIDTGEFGEVWEARVLATGALVAIKFVHPEYVDAHDPMGPSVAERLRREFDILKSIEHPGIVRIFQMIDQPEIPRLGYAMERLVGSNLEQFEAQLGLSSDIMIYVFRRVADALAHLHDHGIVHRDIKASNIFVCDPTHPGANAEIKLIDFGLAKTLDAHAGTRRGSLVGTLENLSPEALTGDPMYQSGAADQWAFGTTMYRLLTGRPAFHGEELLELLDAIRNRPPPPLVFRPTFKNDADALRLVPIVQRCLEKRVPDRYRTMHDITAALAQIEADIDARRAQAGEKRPLQTLDLLVGAAPTERDSSLSEASAKSTLPSVAPEDAILDTPITVPRKADAEQPTGTGTITVDQAGPTIEGEKPETPIPLPESSDIEEEPTTQKNEVVLEPPMPATTPFSPPLSMDPTEPTVVPVAQAPSPPPPAPPPQAAPQPVPTSTIDRNQPFRNVHPIIWIWIGFMLGLGVAFGLFTWLGY